MIRPLHEAGSLRDMICRCKFKGHYLKKYARPKLMSTLNMEQIQNFGRQILETLKFLHEKGFPYGQSTYNSLKCIIILEIYDTLHSYCLLSDSSVCLLYLSFTYCVHSCVSPLSFVFFPYLLLIDHDYVL